MHTTSTSTAQGWDRANGPFSEEVEYDARIVEGSGCAETGSASYQQRMDQVLERPPRGAWSTTEWLSIIVKSSVRVGGLPEAGWISVDICVFPKGTQEVPIIDTRSSF
ncbi:hypothetical protein BDR03DRAFT_951855 [Suillus americanus]|nr:hypothetical protein BDR03DRAFT_951855 [Suillus americanus]